MSYLLQKWCKISTKLLSNRHCYILNRYWYINETLYSKMFFCMVGHTVKFLQLCYIFTCTFKQLFTLYIASQESKDIIFQYKKKTTKKQARTQRFKFLFIIVNNFASLNTCLLHNGLECTNSSLVTSGVQK